MGQPFKQPDTLPLRQALRGLRFFCAGEAKRF